MDAQQQQQQQQQPPMSISISTTTTATSSTGVSLHGRPGYAILIKDEKNNTVRLVQASSAKPMMSRTTAITLGTSTAATATPQVHYVSTSGLSKEAGLELASQIAAFKTQQTGSKAATHSMVAVPISSPTGIKMSALKPEATILPKPAPSNVQRIVALAASPKTPSSVPTAASAETTAAAAAAAAAWASKRVHDYAGSEVCDFTKRHKRVLLGGLSCTAAGKGLRHFSMKVCEKVQRKGVTSYNEVADELVAEFSDPQRSLSPTDQAYDQKNIRRRVYDALNVLMAMNIISKEKKEIRWLGLPTNSAQECENLEAEKNKRLERIRAKTQHLHELILQQIAFKNLVQRNKQMEKVNGTPMANSAIHLPFIIVNTSKKTVIDCSISADKMEYLFSFDNTFEIHDDIEVLKRMGMTHGLERSECPAAQLYKLKKMVPKSLENYVDQIAEGGTSRLTSTSIVAGPSGLLTGRPIGVLSTTSADTRMRAMTHDVASRLAVVVEDAESIDTPTASMQLATTSDEDDFSESEMEVEDDEDIMIDAN